VSARGPVVPKMTSNGTRRCSAPEMFAGRRQRSVRGQDGSTNPDQCAAKRETGAWSAWKGSLAEVSADIVDRVII
jgi:hypothetical protein